jgi:hypothetical protein
MKYIRLGDTLINPEQVYHVSHRVRRDGSHWTTLRIISEGPEERHGYDGKIDAWIRAIRMCITRPNEPVVVLDPDFVYPDDAVEDATGNLEGVRV